MSQNSENKNIGLILTTSGWGGLEMNVIKLSKLLYAKGYNVYFFLLKNTKVDQEISKTQINIYYLLPHMKYFAIFGAYKFSRILKKLSIYNLIAFDNKDLDFVFFTKLFIGYKINLIYQQHMQIGIQKKDLIHTLRFSAINYWITPLELLKNEIVKQTRFNLDKVKVVPLGTDIHKFVKKKYTKSDAREKLGLKNSSYIIGIIGRIDPKKGQLFLIQAINQLRSVYPQVELLIIGEPTINNPDGNRYYKQIKQYISDNDLSNYIHLRGFTMDVNLFYNAIDLFALASENETYGMVTIESMLSGVPIIATNSAGTPELLNYGEFGHLYTPFDIEAFCANVIDIIANIENTIKMAAKGRVEAMKKYSQENECASILELIV